MNKQSYKTVEKLLKEYPKNNVSQYLHYLTELESDKDKDGKVKAWWFTSKFSEAEAVALFKKVAQDGIYIDGEHITLNFKGKVLVTYDYQAYKNKMLMVYPDSKIDLGIVVEGDVFKSSKQDGRVRYTHDIKNPFGEITPENIKGAYCIIKNERGEFLELLGPEDIKKMRSISKMDFIWKTWYDRMVRKSIIKRACKTHFDDITGNMDKLDNETYDLSKIDELEAPGSILKHIETFKVVETLLEWAGSKENVIYHQDETFRKAVKKKQVALLQDIDHDAEVKTKETKK